MLISQAIFSTGWKYLNSKPSYNKVLQCSLCSLAPPPAKVSGSHQNTSDYAGTANYAGTAEWAQLDHQSIQHRDYFGHQSIFGFASEKKLLIAFFDKFILLNLSNHFFITKPLKLQCMIVSQGIFNSVPSSKNWTKSMPFST